jgi:hypothetical protein
MINRFLKIPLKHTDYNTEVNTDKYIVQENVYVLQLIETLIKMQVLSNSKLKYKKFQLTTTKKYITLTHYNETMQKIAKI